LAKGAKKNRKSSASKDADREYLIEQSALNKSGAYSFSNPNNLNALSTERNKVTRLYRVAAASHVATLANDATLLDEERLETLYHIFQDLVEAIDHFSDPLSQAPTELWAGGGHEGINEFIARIYGPMIPKGMTMALLGRADPKAYRAWYDWRRRPENRNMPTPLPTKKQANDQALARFGQKISLANLTTDLRGGRERLKLYRMVYSRRRRAKADSG
jgi:hypothetical protein